MPVIGIGILGVRGPAQHSALPATLYLYAAVMVMMPLMPAPVRSTITRDHYRWVEDPATKPSKGAMVWITVSGVVMPTAVGVGYAVGV